MTTNENLISHELYNSSADDLEIQRHEVEESYFEISCIEDKLHETFSLTPRLKQTNEATPITLLPLAKSKGESKNCSKEYETPENRVEICSPKAPCKHSTKDCTRNRETSDIISDIKKNAKRCLIKPSDAVLNSNQPNDFQDSISTRVCSRKRPKSLNFSEGEDISGVSVLPLSSESKSSLEYFPQMSNSNFCSCVESTELKSNKVFTSTPMSSKPEFEWEEFSSVTDGMSDSLSSSSFMRVHPPSKFINSSEVYSSHNSSSETESEDQSSIDKECCAYESKRWNIEPGTSLSQPIISKNKFVSRILKSSSQPSAFPSCKKIRLESGLDCEENVESS